jgi:hypothetical protein
VAGGNSAADSSTSTTQKYEEVQSVPSTNEKTEEVQPPATAEKSEEAQSPASKAEKSEGAHSPTAEKFEVAEAPQQQTPEGKAEEPASGASTSMPEVTVLNSTVPAADITENSEEAIAADDTKVVEDEPVQKHSDTNAPSADKSNERDRVNARGVVPAPEVDLLFFFFFLDGHYVRLNRVEARLLSGAACRQHGAVLCSVLDSQAATSVRASPYSLLTQSHQFRQN